MTNKLLTQAAYARHRGCSRQAVRQAVAGGRITTFGPDKLVDAELADAQWLRNTRARISTRRADDAPRPPLTADPIATSELATYDEARRRRETAEAALAELRLGEQRGELVRAANVRLAIARQAAGLREALLQMPARLVPVLAADPDPARMDQALRAEIVAALQQITGDL